MCTTNLHSPFLLALYFTSFPLQVPRIPPPTAKPKETKKQKPKPKPSGPQRPAAPNPQPAILPTDPPPAYEPAVSMR